MIGYLAKEASDNHLGGETSTRITFGPKIGLGLALKFFFLGTADDPRALGSTRPPVEDFLILVGPIQ